MFGKFCVFLTFSLCVFFLCLRRAGGQAQQQLLNKLVCIEHEECGACLSAASHCRWCADPYYKSPAPRCNDDESLVAAGCSQGSIQRPETPVWVVAENSSLQDMQPGSQETDKVVQIQPQRVRLSLKPRETKRIQFSYRPAKNYPLDLYYLMDLTWSMKDDKQTLVSLRDDLPDMLKNLTDNFRLGFGSFAEKPLMPFISMDARRKENPCTVEEEACEATYSYKHHLSLTNKVNDFIQNVNQSSVTANLDNAEAQLDALVQAVSCGEKVGWSTRSRKIVILLSDGLMHTAGDGLLGGATRKNDEKCHLDENGYYSESHIYDYPSVAQVYRLLDKYKVNVIFAVTESVKGHYDSLHKLLEDFTYVAKLESDSSNILKLVKTGYDDIVSVVKFDDDSSTGPVKVKYFTDCGVKGGSLIETTRCSGVEFGMTLNYEAHVTLDSCPEFKKSTQTIKISESQLGQDSLTLEVDIQCGCACQSEMQDNVSITCGVNKHLVCGVCLCNQGWSGPDCDCSIQNEAASAALDAQCREPNATRPIACSGAGDCLCGKCECDRGFNGRYCQCKTCDISIDNGLECGGVGRGVCVCGQCACADGWSGAACDCTDSNDSCRAPGSEDVCSGHGECVCGKERWDFTQSCADAWSGNACDCTDSNDSCQAPGSEDVCSGHGECVCGKERWDFTQSCADAWSSNACDCTDSNDSCRAPGSEDVCSGHGECVCGKERWEFTQYCADGWSGSACDCTDSNDSCRAPGSEDVCSGHGECVCCKERWDFTQSCADAWSGNACDCTDSNDSCQAPGSEDVCSGHGECVCGKERWDFTQSCADAWSGNACDCTDSNDSYRAPGSEDVCSGHGECVCGKERWEFTQYCADGWSGSACDCTDSNDSCRAPGSEDVCSGHGECVCGKERWEFTQYCADGWSGSACDCTDSNDSCRAPGSEDECSGHGECVCGKERWEFTQYCADGWSGAACDCTDSNDSCRAPGSEDECSGHEECVCGKERWEFTQYCADGWSGAACDCTDSNDSCQAPGSEDECSGHGECVCGKERWEFTQYCADGWSGAACDCTDSNDSCRAPGSEDVCSGHGECVCGKERWDFTQYCADGWSGAACDCTDSNDSCQAPGSEDVCSGHGECVCGRCQCTSATDEDGEKYSGAFCETCASCENPLCATAEPCVSCHLNSSCTDLCAIGVYNYTVSERLNDPVTDTNEISCILRREEGGLECEYKYTYTAGTQDMVAMEIVIRTKECSQPTSAQIMTSALVIMACVIAGGIIIILAVKSAQIVSDRRAYAKFLQEAEESKKNMQELNPLYISPISEFRLPDSFPRDKND